MIDCLFFSQREIHGNFTLWNIVRVINILIMFRLLRIIWHIQVIDSNLSCMDMSIMKICLVLEISLLAWSLYRQSRVIAILWLKLCTILKAFSWS